MERQTKTTILPRRKLMVIFPLLYISAADVCPRPDPGGTVASPPEVTAANGRLNVVFSFRNQVDPYGITRYCYIDRNNTEAPTLRVKPGDQVILDLKNDLKNELTSEHRHAASVIRMTSSTPPFSRPNPRFSIASESRRISPRACTGIIRIRTATASARCWAGLRAH
jgi:hypothetical protein